MKISISENIKRLRRERDMTQDDLASVMGVTSQSVSKWETGTAYPDVETIPLLANYFDVSVDDLFGMASIRDETRIEEEMKRWLELLLQGPSTNTACRELLGNLAREFPRHWLTQKNYATSLLQPEAKPEDNRKAIEVIERILNECNDNDVRNDANELLISAYERLGEQDRAIALAEKLPVMNQAQEPTLLRLRLREAAIANDRDKLLALYREHTQQAARMLQSPLASYRNLVEVTGITDDEFFLKLVHTESFMYELMFNEDATTQAANNMQSAMESLLAYFYASRDVEKALKHFERHVEMQLSIPRGGGQKSWVPTGETDEKGEPVYEEQYMTAEEKIRHRYAYEKYDPIRSEPRFIAAVQRLLDYENEAAE
ncbi:MAG: helix-turn-helix domain-containing protein [Oscillospiraceae bacterium]|nr:helix-turn-helix domain-containing protein [Oscillospiraceae bacterium]